jgi:UDP-N-acetylglucosamine 3-dehydrogenase
LSGRPSKDPEQWEKRRKTMDRVLPRICFVGCGEMALRHARTLRKLYPSIRLSFASRDPAKARATAQAVNGTGFFGSYEEAAESPESDVAFVTTPPALHAELAVLFAEKYKHLIIEKPVTRNLGELDTLQEAVERTLIRCTVAENYYYKPAIRKIRGHIEAGLIGDVLFVELAKTNRERKTGWRTDRELMGGGALLEGGVHWLNALTSLAGGVPTEVTAFRPGVSYETNVPGEDSLLVVARYSNGVVGKLLHSWRVPNRFRGLGISKIYGTEGVITFESNGLFFSVFGRKKKKGLVSPLAFLGFRPMLRAFVEDYGHGRQWEPSLQRIRQDMQMVHAAYRSLASGRAEEIPPPG